jgi:hypothetical protein
MHWQLCVLGQRRPEAFLKTEVVAATVRYGDNGIPHIVVYATVVCGAGYVHG